MAQSARFYVVVELFDMNTNEKVGRSGSCGTDAENVHDLKNAASIAAGMVWSDNPELRQLARVSHDLTVLESFSEGLRQGLADKLRGSKK